MLLGKSLAPPSGEKRYCRVRNTDVEEVMRYYISNRKCFAGMDRKDTPPCF